MDAPLYSQEGVQISTVAIPEKLFAVRWRPTLVHETVLALQASRRKSTAHSKGRGDVRGGGKKPWRQKGTGRARHGSRRSPLWVGGGVTHGPTKDKNYAVKINKQARRGALASLLSRKFKEEEIFFIDSLSSVDSKTKTAVAMLKKFADATGSANLSLRGGRTLILLGKSDSSIIRAFRNLPYVEVEEARNINVEKAITPKYLIFTKDAIATISA